jgi:hypothetical protein
MALLFYTHFNTKSLLMPISADATFVVNFSMHVHRTATYNLHEGPLDPYDSPASRGRKRFQVVGSQG